MEAVRKCKDFEKGKILEEVRQFMEFVRIKNACLACLRDRQGSIGAGAGKGNCDGIKIGKGSDLRFLKREAQAADLRGERKHRTGNIVCSGGQQTARRCAQRMCDMGDESGKVNRIGRMIGLHCCLQRAVERQVELQLLLKL